MRHPSTRVTRATRGGVAPGRHCINASQLMEVRSAGVRRVGSGRTAVQSSLRSGITAVVSQEWNFKIGDAFYQVLPIAYHAMLAYIDAKHIASLIEILSFLRESLN